MPTSKVLFLILTLGLSMRSTEAFAKCRKNPQDEAYRKEYFNQTEYFIKGRVSQQTPMAPKPKDRVSLKIEVLKVLKGRLQLKSLQVEYTWRPPFEGDRLYANDRIYIFGIRSINDQNSQLDTSNCSPELTESEINRFKAK